MDPTPATAAPAPPPARPARHRLDDERPAITHRFVVDGHKGYLTVGLYPDGSPGEVFIRMAKEGSTVSGLMDSTALAISMSLQHGVPLAAICRKWCNTRFAPSGATENPRIPTCTSISDYVARWLLLKFPVATT